MQSIVNPCNNEPPAVRRVEPAAPVSESAIRRRKLRKFALPNVEHPHPVDNAGNLLPISADILHRCSAQCPESRPGTPPFQPPSRPLWPAGRSYPRIRRRPRATHLPVARFLSIQHAARAQETHRQRSARCCRRPARIAARSAHAPTRRLRLHRLHCARGQTTAPALRCRTS